MDQHQIIKHGGSNAWSEINANGIHAAGPGPSSLGIMQPEGRPQQGKLTTWNKKGYTPQGRTHAAWE